MNKTETCKMPCPVMGFLLRRVMDPSSAPDSHENRTRLGILAGWTSAVLSMALAATKGWLGLISGSISMIADATNNLTDVGSSLVIALGFQWSRKPRDEEHPFGHGRIEVIATLVLAIFLILVGVEVAKSGVIRLVRPKPIEAPVWLQVALGITVAVKGWMAIFARNMARLSKSRVLEADAWNHTFDVVCTLMVVVALASAKMGWVSVDGWTAVGVATFILYTGSKYAREAIDVILGKKPEASEVRSIFTSASSVDGVMGVHEIIVHQYGEVKMVSFHIEVDTKMSLKEAHVISEMAEAAVETRQGWRAVAHIDPVDRSHPLFEELNKRLHQYIADESCLVDVHDLRAEGKAPPYKVSFDLVTDMETRRSDYEEIYQRCLIAMTDAFSGSVNRMEIGIEAVVESAPMERRSFEPPVAGK